VTVVLEDNVTLQSPVPVHPPLQPAKTKPASGVARNDTVAPAAKLLEQVVPQVTPDGVLMTVPLPFFDTESVTALMANFAVQVLFAFIVTEPSEQSASPVHPANLEFVAGTGVKITIFPDV
jgi:hypothetical protein